MPATASPLPRIPRRRPAVTRPARGLISASLLLAACGGGSSPSASGTTGTTSPTTSSVPGTTSPTTPPTGSPGSTSGPPATSPATGTTTPGSPTAPAASGTAATRVVSYRVSYGWHWPNDPGTQAAITHRSTAPALPQLVRIAAGAHPNDLGEVGFDRLAFTFTTGFPSYHLAYTDGLTADASGLPVSLTGKGVLRVVFTGAQAHGVTIPVRSSITAQPKRPLGLSRLVDYAQAGDFEGVLSYGLGVTWPVTASNPQIPVRVIELETVSATGGHQYVVAFDVQTSPTAQH